MTRPAVSYLEAVLASPVLELDQLPVGVLVLVGADSGAVRFYLFAGC